MRYIFLAVFTSIFLSTNLFAKDKKTVIERIEEAESIAVYFVDKKIVSSDYDITYGKAELASFEQKATKVEADMTDELKSLVPEIIEELKLVFKTDKFVYKGEGTEPEVAQMIAQSGSDFVVQVILNVNYTFDYKKKITRKNGNLVSWRSLRGGYTVGFYQPHPKSEYATKCYKQTGSFVYGESFETKSFTLNANVLMNQSDPNALRDKFVSVYKSDIAKMEVKLREKHEKIVAKRNK